MRPYTGCWPDHSSLPPSHWSLRLTPPRKSVTRVVAQNILDPKWKVSGSEIPTDSVATLIFVNLAVYEKILDDSAHLQRVVMELVGAMHPWGTLVLGMKSNVSFNYDAIKSELGLLAISHHSCSKRCVLVVLRWSTA